MSVYNGALNASQIITITDGLSTCLDSIYSQAGLGIPGETGTFAAAAAALKTSIVGDGTTANPGLGSLYEANISSSCDALILGSRWDTLFNRLGRNFVSYADSQLQTSVPSGWLMSTTTSVHYLNNHLLRINGCHTGVPTTPTAAGVLLSTTVSAGAIPTCTAGNAPRVVHTLVSVNSFDESLPSAEATQVANTGNSYSYTISGTVPTGVTYVRIYRSFVGGATSVYYYDQQVAVTAGNAYPVISITQSDAALKQDYNPPAWLSCLLKPEAAAIIALAYAVTGSAGVVAGVPMSLSAVNMVSPTNVALNASNGFLGLGNNSVPQSAQFGKQVVGTGFTASSIQTANADASNLQGFAGATKLQARVTSALNAAGTSAPTYTYYDAAHSYGSPQTATATAATFSGTAVGSTATFTIPAGRLIQTVTADTVSGITSGTYIFEGMSVR